MWHEVAREVARIRAEVAKYEKGKWTMWPQEFAISSKNKEVAKYEKGKWTMWLRNLVRAMVGRAGQCDDDDS